MFLSTLYLIDSYLMRMRNVKPNFKVIATNLPVIKGASEDPPFPATLVHAHSIPTKSHFFDATASTKIQVGPRQIQC